MNQMKNNREMYTCFNCGGVGSYYTRLGDMKRSECRMCKGRKFIWVEPATDEEEDDSQNIPFIRET